MENPIKHYYSVSNIVLSANNIVIDDTLMIHNEFQINFYAGDYLRTKRDISSFSFNELDKIFRKAILKDFKFFIEYRLPSQKIEFLANLASNLIGYSFGREELDYNKFVFLFFQNRTEIVELRGTDYQENYLGIVGHHYEKDLEKIRKQAIFVNHMKIETHYRY